MIVTTQPQATLIKASAQSEKRKPDMQPSANEALTATFP
jgi:hypothetical protein